MVEKKRQNVAVVGAGLVGALEACMLAKRGYNVELYEYRKDIRLLEHVPGRSINLAMSVRGRSALKEIGLEKDVIKNHSIPMYGRMIHELNGNTRAIPYNKDGQCIYSVGRRFVNEVLLSKAESYPNLTCYFEHSLRKVDFNDKILTFTDLSTQETVTKTADVIVGCDGAYSTVRREMLKRPHFNYQQRYIEHGYMELSILPKGDQFAMPKNYLHIWPRDDYMMIALPNQDRSWTVTLFMPFPMFDSLTNATELLSFFKNDFPDAIHLIQEDRLIKDFFANKASAFISVKCSPYNVDGTSVILGDAAHAMVPFFGQGMNCGMEDCVILDELLTQYKDDFSKALPAFSQQRNPDAEAIVDLAMYNYYEMRHLVNTYSFKFRKHLDNTLSIIFPRAWIPLYTMVTFSRERYHICALNKQWQDKVLLRVAYAGGVAAAIAATLGASAYSKNIIGSLQNSWQMFTDWLQIILRSKHPMPFSFKF